MTGLTTNNIDVEIGQRAHALLWQQRRTQEQLARALGISGSVLSRKLRGQSAWSAQQVARTATVPRVNRRCAARRIGSRVTGAITSEFRRSR